MSEGTHLNESHLSQIEMDTPSQLINCTDFGRRITPDTVDRNLD